MKVIPGASQQPLGMTSDPDVLQNPQYGIHLYYFICPRNL